MQRGDILQPYQERPAPPFKDPAAFDHFAPVSGKPVAMLVAGKDYAQVFGKLTRGLRKPRSQPGGQGRRLLPNHSVIQGGMAETVPQTRGYQYATYGFGSAPRALRME